ncbi:hypothetical protein GCM10007063_08870 [Lentibacillus kapialis]|uniref:VWFA domain-containing protein n=1 Tax=Lentibacillus kapialis TaxID=340214 RepID=A0A917UV40_9BACI|nr:VWA domain-containing protein [Lentibacillus kapialis]GGJ88569.1 hypothetical protein GCM10007063_08870 [Lentibacillus kapialis]
MRQIRIFTIILISLLLLVSCSNDSNEDTSGSDKTGVNEQTEKKNDKEAVNVHNQTEKGSENNTFLETLPEVPTDTAGFIHQKQGRYASKDLKNDKVEKKVIKELKRLEPLSKNASDEQLNNYFQYFYKLVSHDFPNPKDLIKKWQFLNFDNPELPDSRFQFKQNYNIEIILDSSGSMAAISGGKTRMELANESINKFLSNVPEKANVSLRVYGHKGTGAESDKNMSCSAIEQVYGFAPYNKKKFQKALNKFEPKGWTPIASALKQSMKSMKEFDSKNNTNLIYLVSDGVGTCGGDPVKVAKSFSKSNAKPIINIIGFQTDAKAQKQLEKMAEASNGIYTTVNNQDELEDEFNNAQEILDAWEEWKQQAMSEAESAAPSHSVDIMNHIGDWTSLNLSQWSHLYRVINIAHQEEIITTEQMEKLQEKAKKVEDDVKKSVSEIKQDLEDISMETIKEIKRKINKKYNKQTRN